MTKHQEEINKFSDTFEWLDSAVPDDEISEKDGGLFQDIRVIESLLDAYTGKNWNRLKHQYSFHLTPSISPDDPGQYLLATSCELIIPGVDHGDRDRVILCTSCIDVAQYPNQPNILMTGLSEATKAGVKVLGRRFGKDLNEERGAGRRESTSDNGRKRAPVKMKPDAKIMKEYLNAVSTGNKEKVSKLKEIYDIKTEEDYA